MQELRYDHPLGLESAPLVESLVTDLGHANERIDTLQAQLDEQAHSLIVAENQSHPLRKENGRLLRENNQLHLELIKKAEAAEKEVKEQQALSVRLQKQNTDLSFISAQHVQQIRTLEEANAGLRDRFNEALQQNGVVLPSGHEVRWHGRKEHMQAHSPVEAAPPQEAEGQGGKLPTETQDLAGLLQSSERQISQLQARLQVLQGQVAAMQEELSTSQQQLTVRDAEIGRLSAQLESGRDYDKLSLKHVEETRKQAIAQLNDQVDFLNARCASMEGELHSKRLAHEQVPPPHTHTTHTHIRPITHCTCFTAHSPPSTSYYRHHYRHHLSSHVSSPPPPRPPPPRFPLHLFTSQIHPLPGMAPRWLNSSSSLTPTRLSFARRSPKRRMCEVSSRLLCRLSGSSGQGISPKPSPIRRARRLASSGRRQR